jgi:PAS domain S-box-containing protein
MPESVAIIPTGAAIGTANAAPATPSHAHARSLRLASALMALVVGLTVCGNCWVYFEGAQIIQRYEDVRSHLSGVAEGTETGLLSQVKQWQLVMTLVMAGGSAALILIAAGTIRARRQIPPKPTTPIEGDWKRRINELRARLAAKEQVMAEMVKERESMSEQISDLTRTKTSLDEELNRRRQVEKSLAQQRQELARSKGVLELHVQARKQEVEKLQRRSELILNSAAEGICGFDLQGKVTFANPAAARVMSLTVAEMIGRREEELFPAFKAPVGPKVDSTEGQRPIELVATRPDASTFAAEYIRSPIHENGRVVGEVLMFKDISERKQAAELLAQRMAELARSNAELEQFAFVASHDLQEPLRKIQAFGDRLKTKCEEVKLEQGRDYLDRMQSAAARMQTLINDLLTFSRVIRRTQPFEPVNLDAVTREVLSDLEVRIEKNGAQVEVGELPTVEGDAMQIRQLLQNLIGNALKFHQRDGKPVVKIQARVVVQPSGRGSTAIFTRQSADGGQVSLGEEFCELSVQDNGIGFDEKYLEKIFAVFSRLHGRHEYEGTGIGLAVCQRIVDRHGGTITAQSKPGQGATFVVRLPLKQSPQPAASA